MGLTEGRYRWNGSDFVSVDGPALDVLVADSFLVDDGRVMGPTRHQERFARDAVDQGLVNSPDDFLDAAWGALPRSGQWFPRLDLTERGELEIWIRPAPELGRTVSIWTTTEDPRTTPTIKGPDISALAVLRERASEHGATEAVILGSSGHETNVVLDGATTCVAWWDDDTLMLPPDDVPRVDSVTVRMVSDMAAEMGVPVRCATATPDVLAMTDTWALNALHGIRGVSGWVGLPTPPLNETRLDEWRAAYVARARII